MLFLPFFFEKNGPLLLSPARGLFFWGSFSPRAFTPTLFKHTHNKNKHALFLTALSTPRASVVLLLFRF